MICIWFSWCHCNPIISCSSKIQSCLPFWCWLTQVVLEKRPLNACSSSSLLLKLMYHSLSFCRWCVKQRILSIQSCMAKYSRCWTIQSYVLSKFPQLLLGIPQVILVLFCCGCWECCWEFPPMRLPNSVLSLWLSICIVMSQYFNSA